MRSHKVRGIQVSAVRSVRNAATNDQPIVLKRPRTDRGMYCGVFASLLDLFAQPQPLAVGDADGCGLPYNFANSAKRAKVTKLP